MTCCFVPAVQLAEQTLLSKVHSLLLLSPYTYIEAQRVADGHRLRIPFLCMVTGVCLSSDRVDIYLNTDADV